MPTSPIRAARVRDPLAAILTLAVSAILANHLSVLAIAEWGARQPPAHLRMLWFPEGRTPWQSTARPSAGGSGSHFRWRYVNADGSVGVMCGNGAVSDIWLGGAARFVATGEIHPDVLQGIGQEDADAATGHRHGRLGCHRPRRWGRHHRPQAAPAVPQEADRAQSPQSRRKSASRTVFKRG